jgi:tetratricopeptide (TPR) repeat protein
MLPRYWSLHFVTGGENLCGLQNTRVPRGDTRFDGCVVQRIENYREDLMSSGFWKHILMLVVAVVIMLCHGFAGIQGLTTAVYVATGAALLSLFLKRHFLRGTFQWSYVLLCVVVVIDRLIMSPATWARDDQASMMAFWQALVEPMALLCLLWLLLSRDVGTFLPSIILLSGLPFSSGNFTWALFPLVALMVFGWVDRGCARREGIGLLIVVVFLASLLVRSPCITTDQNVLNLIVLFLAGFWIGGASGRSSRSLLLMGLVLLGPVLLGLFWSVLVDQYPPSYQVWGINPNLASAQGSLGLLLLFLWFHARVPWFSWLLLCLGILTLIPFGSIWTVACLVMVSSVSILRGQRLRTIAVWCIAALPIVTMLLIVLPADLFPERVSISVAARQFHWKSVLRSLVHRPFGEGIGTFHPKVLGFAEPADQLASIPGSLMQHAHHFLLHLAEQAGWIGILLPLLFMIPWVHRFSKLPTRSIQWSAGAGFLFAWASNAADLSALSVPFIIASGMLLAIARPWQGSPDRCIVGRISVVALLSLAGVIWFSALMAFGSAESLRQGRLLHAQRLATTSLAVWPPAPTALRVLEEMKIRHPLLARARDDSVCSSTVPQKVEVASRLLARGLWRQAESLLVTACRLDPWGVLQRGGATARVFLATMAKDRGDIERSDSLLSGLCWKEAEEIRVTGEVDYYLLRGLREKAKAVVGRFTPRAAAEKRLLHSLMVKTNIRQRMGHETVAREPKDRIEQLNDQIAFLIEWGRVAQAEAAYKAAEPWLGDHWQGLMMQSKIAAAKGDMETAIAAASQAVSLSNGALHARWELVQRLSHGQRKEEAYRQAQLIVDEAPNNGEAWLLLAKTLLDLGKGDDAKRALDNAARFGADDLSVGIAKAQALRMMGRAAQAQALLLSLAREHESSTVPFWQLASWAEEQGDLVKTMKWGKAALRRDPDDPGCNVLIGRAFRKRGRVQQATTYLSRVSKDENAPHGWRIDAEAELELLRQQRSRGQK